MRKGKKYDRQEKREDGTWSQSIKYRDTWLKHKTTPETYSFLASELMTCAVMPVPDVRGRKAGSSGIKFVMPPNHFKDCDDAPS